MIWIICFFIVVFIALLALPGAFYLVLGKYRRGRRVHSLDVLITMCFLAALLLSIPPHYNIYGAEEFGFFKALVMAAQRAFRVFGADRFYEVVLAEIDAAPAWLANAYVLVTLTVQLLAPILSFGFVLSFFKNVAAHLRYALAYFRETYVFSALNGDSLALATNVLEQHNRARIVFTDVDEKARGANTDLIESAKELGAICFKKDITAIRFGFHSRRSPLYFFTNGKDELRNVEQAFGLIDRFRDRKETNLYVFCKGAEGELLLAGKDKGQIKVRRVDDVHAFVSHFLYTRGTELLANALPPNENGLKEVHVVLAGLGADGTELLRALTWYCQIEGYCLTLDAFDRDPLVEDRLAALCPDLLSPRYNGVHRKGEADYTIRIHAGVDVRGKRFFDQLAVIGPVSAVFVCLGVHERNVQAAVDLRMWYERIGTKPIIYAMLAGDEAQRALSGAKNSAGQPYDICYIGNRESLYCTRVILHSALEADAYARHCAYCNGDREKEEDFWRYEYCYRSSMASALAAHTRVQLGIPGAEKEEAALSEEERNRLERMEHRRWNAYMRAEGYVYSGSPEKSSRNDLGKMHHNLVVFDELREEDQRKDSRIAAKTAQDGE